MKEIKTYTERCPYCGKEHVQSMQVNILCACGAKYYFHTHKWLSRKPQTNAEVAREWIPVTERLPDQFVSVLGYMTDAGNFPPVRECYLVGKAFYFPALCDVHPVSHWMPLPEPPMRKGENG